MLMPNLMQAPIGIRWLTHVAIDSSLLVINGRLQFFTSMVSPEGCLSVLMTWELASPRASGLRKRTKRKPQRLL